MTSEFKIDSSEFFKGLEEVVDASAVAAQDAVYEAAQYLADVWISTNIPKDTGFYRSSAYVTHPETPEQEIFAGFSADYAIWVERNHPKNKKYLEKTQKRALPSMEVVADTQFVRSLEGQRPKPRFPDRPKV